MDFLIEKLAGLIAAIGLWIVGGEDGRWDV